MPDECQFGSRVEPHSAAVPEDDFMSMAVIVPTRNRPVDLPVAVSTVLAQTVLPSEMIIVDQSPQDDSKRAIAELFATAGDRVCQQVALKYIHNPAISGLTTARNEALRHSRSDVVLFLDDDVELESDFIEKLLTAYAEYPEVAGVSGIVTNYVPEGLLNRLWRKVFVTGPFHDDRQAIYHEADRLRHSPPLPVTRLGGGLMSFRSSAIRDVPFDANLKGASEGEDVDFCMHLGPAMKLMIHPGARLVHKGSPAGRVSEHWIGALVRGNTYLYYRNWNSGLRNRACFIWLKAGYSLLALAASVRRGDLAPWRTFQKALRQGRQLGRGEPPC
jgi:glucosyl-dolichyl phosphate glucuronosyltransferase